MSQAFAVQSFVGPQLYAPSAKLSNLKPDVTTLTPVVTVRSIAVSAMSNDCVYRPIEDNFETMTGLSEIGRRMFMRIRPVVLGTLLAEFERLAAQWKLEKTALSSITAIAMLPSYQRIIGMGKPAIRLILSQLEREGDQPDMWFWALRSITGEDPISDEDRGDVVAMAEAWIRWGDANGVS